MSRFLSAISYPGPNVKFEVIYKDFCNENKPKL